MTKGIILEGRVDLALLDKKVINKYHPARFASVKELLDAMSHDSAGRKAIADLTMCLRTKKPEDDLYVYMQSIKELYGDIHAYLFVQVIYAYYFRKLMGEEAKYTVLAKRLWRECLREEYSLESAPLVFKQFADFHEMIMDCLYPCRNPDNFAAYDPANYPRLYARVN